MNRRDSLVAINLIVNGQLENENGVPMLYYWDGNSELIDELTQYPDFREYLVKTCLTRENYNSKTALSYVYFKVDEEGNETYTEERQEIQDILKLADLNNEEVQFVADYIRYYFNFLYKCSFKTDYNFAGNMKQDINDIYVKIKDKYPEKIIMNTVVNYVRAELTQKDGLNSENTEWIINMVNRILNGNK